MDSLRIIAVFASLCFLFFFIFSKLNRLYSSLGGVATGNTYDLVVVGGGIVGVACARELSIRYPNKTIAIVEKEDQLGTVNCVHCK